MSDGKVQAAVVAALVTLSVALLGEMFLRRRERRVRRESATAVYRKYADPLAAASTALFYRLREIFDERGGGFYLQNHEHVVRYEHYKAISTLYRLAAFLGWVQGLKRELFFVPRTRPRPDAGLERKLRRMESALADGGRVEEVRLESLLRLWNITAPTIPPTLAKLATKLDFRLDRRLSELGAVDANSLSAEAALQLCRYAADTITTELQRPEISDRLLVETQVRTIEYISVRENWIYRDWQAAIGDLMLRSAEEGPRRYEVVGFGEFERMCKDGDPATRLWLSRLNGVIDQLDVRGELAKDARIQQLRDVFDTLCSVIQELHRVDVKGSPLSTETIAAVDEITNMRGTNSG